MNKQKIILLLSLIVLIITGVMYMRYTWLKSINETSNQTLKIVKAVETALNDGMLKSLRGVPEDIGTPSYESIKKRLIQIRSVQDGVRFVYLYTQRDGRIFIIADSEPAESKDYSPPGQEYTEADLQYYKPFESGESLITRPVKDCWGTWVSILVPVKNYERGKTIAVLAMDYPAEMLNKTAVLHTAKPGIIVLFLLLLLITFYELIDKNIILVNEKSLKHTLSIAIEQSPVTVVITDPSGNIEFVNPKFVETTGYTASEAIGQNPRILKSADKPASEYKQLWDTILSGKSWHGVFQNKKKNGELYYESAVISPVKDDKGTIMHFLAVKENITERIETENKLLEAKQEAELLREKAEAGSSSKSEFLASMSHEIRTPMNGVISMTGLLLGTPLTDDQKRFAGIIRSSGEALLAIINDILDFSKIEAYKLDLETVEFNLTKTVGETIELMEVKANEKGLSLDLAIDDDVPEYLRGDSGRLRQILLNLLSNAIKFTASGSVKLGVVLEEDIGSWVRLCVTVADTGIGIPADKLDKIFSPFTQADSSVTRKFGGTGLGLAISSNLVQLMGGEIKVESEYGKGSEFRFTIIFEKQSEIRIKADKEKQVESVFITASHSNARILLAEDNYTNQIVAVEMLKKIGYNQVDIAANGLEVIAALQDINYDLILMDCHMSEMDGFEASRRIRDKQTGVLNNQIPIIAMTALAMTSDKEEAIGAGMNDFLIKPVELIDLAKMLEKWLSKVAENSKENPKMNDIKNSKTSEPAGEHSAEVFNKASFLSRLMNDENLAVKIGKAFLEDMPKQIDKLSDDLKSGDAAAAGHQAHKIRGASANVGGEAMRDAAIAMETAGASGDIESLKKLMPELQREFELLKEAMEKD